MKLRILTCVSIIIFIFISLLSCSEKNISSEEPISTNIETFEQSSALPLSEQLQEGSDESVNTTAEATEHNSPAPSSEQSLEERIYDTIHIDHATLYFSKTSNFTEQETGDIVSDSTDIVNNMYEHNYVINQTYKYKIYFGADMDDTFADIDSKSSSINPSESQKGAIVFLLSGGKLPAWLCAGLENYWLNKDDDSKGIDDNQSIEAFISLAGKNNNPTFGDLWFVPGLIGDDEGQALAIATLFVKYLDTNGNLDTIIDQYANSPDNANVRFKSLWEEFTGTAFQPNDNIDFRYMYNKKQDTSRVAVCANGELNGNYHFCGSNWSLQQIMDYITYSEYGINFAKELFGEYFGYYYDKLPNVYFDDFGNESLYTPAGEALRINTRQSSPFPHVVVHEFVHALTQFYNFSPAHSLPTRVSIFRSPAGVLEEGLCTMIDYLEKSSHTNPEYVAYLEELHVNGMRSDEFETTFDPDSMMYIDINGNKRIDGLALLHVYANSYNNYPYKLASAEDGTIISSIDYINNYFPAASFLAYLLEQSSINELFYAYQNADGMSETYGKSLSELADDWIIYCDKFLILPKSE